MRRRMFVALNFVLDRRAESGEQHQSSEVGEWRLPLARSLRVCNSPAILMKDMP